MLFKHDADEIPGAIEGSPRVGARRARGGGARRRSASSTCWVNEFSAADIMMGYTVVCVRWFGMLSNEFPGLNAYLDRLQERPAFEALAA